MNQNPMLEREAAWQFLTQYAKSESLRKHAIAVEILMRAQAEKYGEDVETWGAVGLLHDFDYEIHPEFPDHPARGSGILRERGFPEPIIRAIASHVEAMKVPRETLLEKALFACDELAGFLVAAALVRPGKSILGMETKSIRKKLKDKAFARAVNREEILRGAAELGVDLDEHIGYCIRALERSASVLGLDGPMPPAGATDQS